MKSIEEEAALCRARFAGVEVGSWVRCCHHKLIAERLCEPAENRIRYILTEKPVKERPRRLHEFWLIPEPLAGDYEAKVDALDADYRAKVAALYADYRAKHNALYADYRAKHNALAGDYEAKHNALAGDYEAKRDALAGDYEAKRDALDAPIVAMVPDTTWDGESIFGKGWED